MIDSIIIPWMTTKTNREMMPPELPAMKSVDLILNMNDDVPKMRFLAVWSRIDEVCRSPTLPILLYCFCFEIG